MSKYSKDKKNTIRITAKQQIKPLKNITHPFFLPWYFSSFSLKRPFFKKEEKIWKGSLAQAQKCICILFGAMLFTNVLRSNIYISVTFLHTNGEK